MAVIRNADGSRTVGIIKQSAKKEKEPTPIVEVVAEPEVVEEITEKPVKAETKPKAKKTTKK